VVWRIRFSFQNPHKRPKYKLLSAKADSLRVKGTEAQRHRVFETHYFFFVPAFVAEIPLCGKRRGFFSHSPKETINQHQPFFTHFFTISDFCRAFSITSSMSMVKSLLFSITMRPCITESLTSWPFAAYTI